MTLAVPLLLARLKSSLQFPVFIVSAHRNATLLHCNGSVPRPVGSEPSAMDDQREQRSLPVAVLILSPPVRSIAKRSKPRNRSNLEDSVRSHLPYLPHSPV